jgi:tRNA G10  N-methylase Trm11
MLFLEPFAGAGGVIIEAFDAGYTVLSLDIDKRLRHGLKALGSLHLVAEATCLPFDDGMFTAIATEPPYHRNTRSLLLNAFNEFYRVLKPGGRLSMLVAQWQAESLLKHSATYSVKLLLTSPVNRKGTEVVVLVWEKGP